MLLKAKRLLIFSNSTIYFFKFFNFLNSQNTKSKANELKPGDKPIPYP